MDMSVDLAVLAIHEDDLGFMWFGTEDGLFRVDGYSVRSYRPIPFDAASISNPSVNAFADADDAGFWVITQSGGLNRYDAMKDVFIRYPDVAPARLSGIAVDADTIVWISTNMDGLIRFDPTSGESVGITTSPDEARALQSGQPTGLPSNLLTTVKVTRNGTMWVGTRDAGLCRFNRTTGSCRVFAHDPVDQTSIPGDRVQALLEDEAGQLWVGTFGGGVARFDESTDSFVRYPASSDTRGQSILALLERPDGGILIGSDVGLDLLDPKTGARTLYRHAPGNPSSIAAGAVYSLYTDVTGVVWIGTDTGVSYFNATSSPFQHYTHEPDNPNSLSDPEVWSVFEDDAGDVWVGTTSGLNQLDRQSGKVTRYFSDPSDPASLATGLVMGINQTKDGSFWVTTRRGGLHLFDRSTGRVVARYTEIRGDTTSLLSEIPWWILEDRRGRTWITSGGAGCLLQMPDPGRFIRHCHDPENPDTPAHNFARQMIEARDGTLWLGTWGGGLDRIDPESLKFTHYRYNPDDRNTPSSDFVIAIREDDNGILWLGTYGAGFSRFDPVNGSFTHYTSHNSDLPNDAVYEIQLDDGGRLWLSTNAGLVRFDPTSGSFRSFGVADGIQDLEFNSGASFRSSTGEMFFGGVNGINAFYPENVASDELPPRVVMTGLRVGGKDVERPGPDAPMSVALPHAEELRLRPDQRDIAIMFGVLHQFDPEHNRYRYRLDDADNDWHVAGAERTATYTNLDPGAYVFRVAAANSDGVWNEEALAVSVFVEPYFYETSPAKMVYGFLLAGLVFALLRIRRNRLVLQHKLELEHVESAKLRDLDRTRSVFFANVSHEFRTPLTLTLGPIDDLLAGLHGAVSETARQQLVLARRNAARVLDLINQILDIARLEAGRTALRARAIDLQAFVDEVALVFVSLAGRKAISFDVERSAEPLEVWADPIQLEKVLFNLLSNAFKFTRNGGTVKVQVGLEGGRARVSVRDNGPGIPAAEIPYVFDRFHQGSGPSTRAQPGTGIGLALSREIVEQHKGEIHFVSEEGFGSTFSVFLPLGKNHLSPEQIDESPLPRPADSVPDAPFLVIDDKIRTGPGGDGAEAIDRDVTTVLVVEDHPDGRAYIRFHLERYYRVLEAADGVQGLEMTRSELPDLVLSDVMMPNKDGFELCRALKSDPETDFIPVMLLTARASHEDRMEGLNEQADAYLTKPFDPEELRVQIANLIARGQRLKQRFAAPTTAKEPHRTADAPVLKSSDAVFMERVVALVESNMSDDSFSVEQLADEMGVSRTQLFRMIRRLNDQSPSELIRDMRLDRAASMLECAAGNVSEVAYATGFKSLSHFSRCFTQRFACRPSAYRSSKAPIDAN
jgi:signal transduction histidine kinase/ligand-binding sensor domain-containing protein/DNA-binding response OmpR family regulator